MDLRAPIASCFLVALLASSPATATAQGLSAQDEANARFQTGLKYYDNHDFESARLAFKQAYAVLQKPSILLNLALSELYSNHALDSLPHFEDYIKDPSTPPDKREKARKHLEEAMKKTSHLQIRTATDAEVKIDGRVVAPPYTMVHVMPGAHAVEARVGAKTKSANIDAKPGDTIPMDLLIEGEPSAPPIDASSSSDARSSMSPPTAEPPVVPPEPSSWWMTRTLGVVAWVGGAAAVTAGGVLLKSADDKADDGRRAAEGVPTCTGISSPACDAARDAASTSAQLMSGATVALVGGATLVASGFVLFLWPRQKTTANSAAFVVQGSGVGFTRSF